MLKRLLLLISLISSYSVTIKGQTTFPWSGTYGGAGTNRTYTTTVSGVTMSATMVNSENVWQDASPRWFPSGSTVPGGGCSGIGATNEGMLLSTDWTTNATKTITTTITFSAPVQGPVNFFLYDINDDGFGSWVDRIIITGTNSAAAAVNVFKVGTACVQTGGSVTGSGTNTLTFNSGMSTACTCWGNNEINVGTSSDCISTVTIQYKSANTTYNNPKQYIVISNVKATIPAAAAAPTSITGTTTICSGQSTTLTAVGGSASSQWYTGSCGGTLIGTGASVTVSPSSSTTYFVRNGGSACSPASTCISATVTVNPAPVMTSSNTATICSGGTVNIPLASDFGTSYTWIASNNANTSGESTTLQSSSTLNNTITSSSSTSQTVTYTVTPTGGGCQGSTQTVSVTVNPAPTMTSSSSASICTGGTVNIPLTSNVASSYTWIANDNGNTTGESTSTQSTSTINNTITNTSTSSQTITYTVTPTSTAGACAGSTQTVTVTVNPAPTMTSANNTSICSGNTLAFALSSDIGASYSWIASSNANVTGESTTTQSGSTLNNTLTNTTSSPEIVTYTVTPTSTVGSCAGSTQTVAVTVNPAPTMTSANTATICSGGTVNIPLTSSSAATYTWIASNNVNTNGESTTTQVTSTIDNTITNSSTSTQIVTYTVTPTSSGCIGATQTVSVTVNPLPAMTSGGSATICSGSTVNIPLTSNIASSYTWIAGDNMNTTGESTSLQNTSTLNNTITNSSGSVQTITYTVTPTSSAGACAGTTQTVTVTVNPTPSTPVISPSGPTTFCAGESITLTSSSTSGNTWSTGATTQAITVSTAGTYTVSVTDGNGCTSSTASTTITINPLPSAPAISASGPTTFCSGGSVTLTSSSATGNIWSTGATTQSITVNAAGTYTVSYVDGNGCTSSTASTVVTVVSNPPTPVVTAGGPLTFCSGGTVTLTSSSATGNTWSTGETTQSITVSSSGTYSVTVGASGCSSTSANTSVTVNTLPATPIVATSGPTTFCTGGSVTLTSSSTTGNTWSTGATTQSITVNAGGNYTVSVTDGNGCTSSTASTTVTVNPLPATPTVSASGPITFCQGGSVTLSSSSATGNTWSTGATTQNIVVNASGTYTVSVTDGNGCTSATGSTSVIVNPNPSTPTVSLNGPATFCSGNNVVLTSSSSSGNSWSTGETTQSITVSNSGNYSVTVSDINGCTASSANTSITVNTTTTTPAITDSGLNICAGQTTTLTSSSTTGNTWSTGETTQTITVNTSGTYTLTTDDGSGCPSAPASVVVTVTSNPTTPIISASGPLTFCAGDSVTLTSNSVAGNTWSTGETTQSIVVSTSGNYTVTVGASGCSAVSAATTTLELPLPATPSISNNGLVFCAGQSTTLTSNNTTGNNWSTGETTQSIIVTSSGNYWLTFTDSNGCTSDSTSVTVTANPLPASPLVTANSPLAFCQGDSVTLTASPGTGILWTPGNTTDSTLTVNNSGAYTVTFTDANGCTSTSAPVTVTVNTIPSSPSLSVTGGSNAICQGQTATLNANPATGITWTPGGQTTSSINVSTAGTYYASYTDANGCTSPIDSITITVNPLPQIASTVNIDSAFCNTTSGGINNITVTGGTGTYSYQWFNGSTAAGTDSTLSNVSSGNYTLIVTDQAGCSDTSSVMTVPSAGGISVSLSANPTSGMEPFNTNVLATTSTTANSYTWFNNNSLIAGETDSIANLTGLTQGTYNTTVIVTDSYGCADTATITISVDGNIDLVIPNVFSPNGDNTNDVFFITAEGYKELHLEIYDRWGLKLWEVTGLNPSWDGRTTAGLEVTDGTYYYILRGVDFKNTTMEKTGYLSVVK